MTKELSVLHEVRGKVAILLQLLGQTHGHHSEGAQWGFESRFRRLVDKEESSDSYSEYLVCLINPETQDSCSYNYPVPFALLNVFMDSSSALWISLVFGVTVPNDEFVLFSFSASLLETSSSSSRDSSSSSSASTSFSFFGFRFWKKFVMQGILKADIMNVIQPKDEIQGQKNSNKSQASEDEQVMVTVVKMEGMVDQNEKEESVEESDESDTNS
ncbi:hypothetical protein QOT17_013304 [Balamuthia mandrillaris]